MDAHYDYLIKVAGISPSVWSRVGSFMGKYKPTWAGAKSFMVGKPRELAHQVRSGKAWQKGGLVREGLTEGFKDPVSFGLFYGMPAYEAYKVSKDPNVKNKGRAIGGLLGSSALGMAAWRPTGMLGSTVAGGIGQTLGEQAGSIFSK